MLLRSRQDNYILPSLIAGNVKTPTHMPSAAFRPRSRNFCHLNKRINVKPLIIVPDTDDWWYSPPSTSAYAATGFMANVLSVPVVLSPSTPDPLTSTFPTAYLSPHDRLRDYPLPQPGYERSTNLYGLDAHILPLVSFLADTTVNNDIPVGLSIPKSEMHEVPLARAQKDPIKFPPALLKASTDKEMTKMWDQYAVFREVTDFKTQVHANALSFLPWPSVKLNIMLMVLSIVYLHV